MERGWRVRVKELGKRTISFAQRPVRCEECGAVLFDGVPVVARGRVKIVGAERALVRVDFDSMNRLVFRHVEAERCRREAERDVP